MNGFNNPDDPPPSYQSAVNDGTTRPNSSPNFDSSIPTAATERERERDPTHSRGLQTYTHALYITASTHRTDLAYPTEWAHSRNVSQRDWDTFVARLFSGARDGGPDAKRLSDERVQHIAGVISGWNQDFFQPRGILIRWEDKPGVHDGHPSVAPSSGSASRFPSHPSIHSHHQHSSPRPSPPLPPQRPQHGVHHQASQLPSRSSLSTKQRLANKIKDAARGKNVSLTSTHIRVGNAISLDAETGNVKIGKFSLTDKGMNYDGRPIGPQIPPHMLPHHHGHGHLPPPHHHRYGSPSSFGGGPRGHHHPPPQGAHAHHYHDFGHHGPGAPSSHSGGYGPPRHVASWGSPPAPPQPRPPFGSQTWGPSGQAPFEQPQGHHGYGPPSHGGPWSSYNTPQGHSSPHGQYSAHQGQTTGTTW